MDQENKNKNKSIDPLASLDDIENVNEVLSKSDIHLINSVFNNIEDFNQIIDNFEYAIGEKEIDKKDLERILDSIFEVVNYRIREKVQKSKKKRSLLFRLIFELPELIRNG